MTDFLCKACNGTGRAEFSNSLTSALALYLNEVQPVDGRVQINVSIDEMNVLRRLTAAAPAAPEHRLEKAVEILRRRAAGYEDRATALFNGRIMADELRANAREIELLADSAATPAVGREREALINAIDSPTVQALARVFDTPPQRMDKSFSEQIVEILAPRLAAQPASPLRGRDDLIPAGKQAKFKHGRGGDWFGVFDWHNNPESFEYRTVYALSTSSPEQAADPLAKLVSGFSKVLLAKLRLGRANGKSGWERDDWEQKCQQDLLAHLEKGDPRDIAAYCAFMWHHNWLTVAPEQPAALRGSVNDKVSEIVYQMSPAEQYDLAFKVAENVGYMLVREPEHPDSPVDGEARELAAEMIYYSDFHFVGGPKPEWIPGGNSFKQDEARKIANAILALAALPASPLRGRELEGLIDRLDRYDTSDARGLCWEAAAAIRVLTDAAYKNASMKK